MKPTGRAEQRMGKEAGCKCEPHRRSPSATKALVQRQLLRLENRGEERRVLQYGRREGRVYNASSKMVRIFFPHFTAGEEQQI